MDTDQVIEDQALSPTLIQLPKDLPNLNRWLFETIQPYIKARALEMGSGLGEMSALFANHDIPIHLSVTDKGNRDKLREKFSGISAIRGVHNINFLHPDFDQKYSSISEVFSTLVALNLTEHGYDDKTAISNAKHLLRKRGHLMAIAPAHTALYQGLEEDLEDWKKYNRRSVNRFLGNDFEILLVRYFNVRENIDDSLHERFGLSVLVVARKI